MLRNLFKTLFGLVFGLVLFAVGVLGIAVMYVYPTLPTLKEVTNYHPRMPLEVYTSDRVLIGVYGEERREFTSIDKFPVHLKQAVLAAEDKRFYEHWGVDVIGVARAMIGNLQAGGVRSGASTITQQVARNFYLTNEKSYRRKFEEALLAYKIEQALSKDQILELYLNHIYLGQRAYGFAAAAKIYFGKDVAELTIAESAMLAGLPKAPSAYNPIVNPQRAQLRQHYVLNNMAQNGYINAEQLEQAKNEELDYPRQQFAQINQDALYVAEMARQEVYRRYGEAAYTSGWRVYTTVHSEHQRKATEVLRDALRQHGTGSYRGVEASLDWNSIETLEEEERAAAIAQFLEGFYVVHDLYPAVVIGITRNKIEAVLLDGNVVEIKRPTGDGAPSWTQFVNASSKGDGAIRLGSVIRVRQRAENKPWEISQIPELQGALVSLDPRTGAIRALVGGYDFHSKSFNRATQAQRQPGSIFKPFIYSAALAGGMTAVTPLNDAPLPASSQWQPNNADGRYRGPTPLNQSLIWSRNLPAVRVVSTLGVSATHGYVQRFGFPAQQVPQGLSMSLGTGTATPLQMAEAYAVLANGGYRIASHIIDRIVAVDKEGHDGRLVARVKPLVAGLQTATDDEAVAPQVIDPRNAYIITSILQQVISKGTGTHAKIGNRKNIAGKTGTTDEAKDVWFAGYSPHLLAVVYLGYDQPRSMGGNAFGGRWAAPVWHNYMAFALENMRDTPFPKPNGLVQSNGVYFLKERQETDSSLAIDNRSVPVAAPSDDPLGDLISSLPNQPSGQAEQDSNLPSD